MRNLSLALVLTLLASTPEALACGGGGSGSYRKPARPGQHQHQHSCGAIHPAGNHNSPSRPPVGGLGGAVDCALRRRAWDQKRKVVFTSPPN